MIFISQVPGILTCFYNKEYQLTQQDWCTFHCSPQESKLMRDAIEKYLDFIQIHKVQKHLINVKDCCDAFTEEDQKFIQEYFFPRTISLGIRYIANIMSEDVYTQLSTEEWQNNLKNNLIILNFRSLEVGRAWLAAMN